MLAYFLARESYANSPFDSSTQRNRMLNVLNMAISAVAAYMSWMCNGGMTMPMRVFYAFFAFCFGIFYIAYAFLFRFDKCRRNW